MRFAYNSDQSAMFRVKTLRGFERMIRAILERHEKPYRLFISYKCRHRIKNWRTNVSCGMKPKRRATESMWRAANKASESRDSTEFGRRYSSQTNASENIRSHLRTRVGGKMKTTSWTIKGAFGIIGEIFDELSHADRAWKACGCGESVRETIEEAIRTYKSEVEKMNEKVEKLERKNDDSM